MTRRASNQPGPVPSLPPAPSPVPHYRWSATCSRSPAARWSSQPLAACPPPRPARHRSPDELPRLPPLRPLVGVHPSHRGQLWPFNYVIGLDQPAIEGLSRFGNTQLYVTCGAGYWGPPMRIGARPEVTVVELRSSSI